MPTEREMGERRHAFVEQCEDDRHDFQDFCHFLIEGECCGLPPDAEVHRMSERHEPRVSVFVCGGDLCTDGEPHDSKATVPLYGSGGAICGESVACSRCGSSAFDRDMLRLP